MILRNTVFREQEMIWQDQVDCVYLMCEYDPCLLEHDIKKPVFRNQEMIWQELVFCI